MTDHRPTEAEVVLKLQGFDLRQKHPVRLLNGHTLRFRETTVDGKTLFLPTGLTRGRGGWQLRIRHRDGIWRDELRDQQNQTSPIITLYDAWFYLISTLRTLEPVQGRTKNPRVPELHTGLNRVTWLVSSKRSRVDPEHLTWRFGLRFAQRSPDKKMKYITVGHWTQFDVSDGAIRQGLIHAAALVNYRHHLDRHYGPDEYRFIGEDEKIPVEFWPGRPVHVTTTEDLFRYVKRQKGELVSMARPANQLWTGMKGITLKLRGRARENVRDASWAVTILMQNPWHNKRNPNARKNLSIANTSLNGLSQSWLRHELKNAFAIRRYAEHLYSDGAPEPVNIRTETIPPEFHHNIPQPVPTMDAVMAEVINRAKSQGFTIPEAALPWA